MQLTKLINAAVLLFTFCSATSRVTFQEETDQMRYNPAKPPSQSLFRESSHPIKDSRHSHRSDHREEEEMMSLEDEFNRIAERAVERVKRKVAQGRPLTESEKDLWRMLEYTCKY